MSLCSGAQAPRQEGFRAPVLFPQVIEAFWCNMDRSNKSSTLVFSLSCPSYSQASSSSASLLHLYLAGYEYHHRKFRVWVFIFCVWLTFLLFSHSSCAEWEGGDPTKSVVYFFPTDFQQRIQWGNAPSQVSNLCFRAMFSLDSFEIHKEIMISSWFLFYFEKNDFFFHDFFFSWFLFSGY